MSEGVLWASRGEPILLAHRGLELTLGSGQRGPPSPSPPARQRHSMCGFIGIYGPDGVDVAGEIYEGLLAVQQGGKYPDS